MKVFVTGGAGYIGSVCVEELLRAGHEVTVYDNLSEGHRAAVAPGAKLEVACLSDRNRLHQAFADVQPEAVVHFAAHALVGESMTNPTKYFHNNVALGIQLLEACVQGGVGKFIFSSTCATYGHPDRVPITEDNPPRPINPYGESKHIFERMLHWYHEIHGLDYVALRYFNAAGASEKYGEHHRVETHLIPNVLKVALGQSPHCEVYGTDYPTPDGTCIRDFIHVVDLAQAHILAMECEHVGAYNLGTGQGYSVREVIHACEKVSGESIKTAERPRRSGDPPRLVASADKARTELGWEARITKIESIVESAWKWHQAHPEGYPE